MTVTLIVKMGVIHHAGICNYFSYTAVELPQSTRWLYKLKTNLKEGGGALLTQVFDGVNAIVWWDWLSRITVGVVMFLWECITVQVSTKGSVDNA